MYEIVLYQIVISDCDNPTFFHPKRVIAVGVYRCSQVSMAAKHLGVSSKPSQAETEPPEAQHLEGNN